MNYYCMSCRTEYEAFKIDEVHHRCPKCDSITGWQIFKDKDENDLLTFWALHNGFKKRNVSCPIQRYMLQEYQGKTNIEKFQEWREKIDDFNNIYEATINPNNLSDSKLTYYYLQKISYNRAIQSYFADLEINKIFERYPILKKLTDQFIKYLRKRGKNKPWYKF